MPKRRGHAESPHENEERWLLTYSDMITLLFVLFVVMYAISNTDVRKFVALAESMQAAFNTDVLQGQQPVTIMSGAETVPMNQTYDAGSGVVATDFRTIQATLQDYAISQGLGGEVEVGRIPEGIVIRLNDALLFSPGRANLNAQAQAVVQQVAGIVRPLPNAIRVEGDTDDQPPDGGLYPDNWQLSTARALAVVDALQGLGIPPDRLSATGYAQYNPLVPNTDAASRARNRRVDMVLLYPQPEASMGAPATSIPSPAQALP